jgi:hypothetical protein
MIATRNDRTIRDVGQSVAIGDKHFEVVKEFVYLGSLMNRCFFGLRKHLQSNHLSRQTKFTIHKTLIRPVLLYGSETCVLTKREENQLLVFERKVLRQPECLKCHETSRLRYAGHMIRKPEDLPQKALFRAKPNRRRNQGRPKSRRADGVISDSLALGGQRLDALCSR